MTKKNMYIMPIKWEERRKKNNNKITTKTNGKNVDKNFTAGFHIQAKVRWEDDLKMKQAWKTGFLLSLYWFAYNRLATRLSALLLHSV